MKMQTTGRKENKCNSNHSIVVPIKLKTIEKKLADLEDNIQKTFLCTVSLNLDIMLALDPIQKKLALTYNNQAVPSKGYKC